MIDKANICAKRRWSCWWQPYSVTVHRCVVSWRVRRWSGEGGAGRQQCCVVFSSFVFAAMMSLSYAFVCMYLCVRALFCFFFCVFDGERFCQFDCFSSRYKQFSEDVRTNDRNDPTISRYRIQFSIHWLRHLFHIWIYSFCGDSSGWQQQRYEGGTPKRANYWFCRTSGCVHMIAEVLMVVQDERSFYPEKLYNHTRFFSLVLNFFLVLFWFVGIFEALIF